MKQIDRHRHIEELLGVYALDALDGTERALVEAHLPHCPTCQAEVGAYHQITALLAPPETGPPDLWEGIVAALEEAPRPLELAPVVPFARRGSRSVRILAAMTAVAAAAIVVLGVRLVGQDQRLNRMQTALTVGDMQRTALAAIANPAANKVELRSPGGRAAGQVALLPDGRGFLLADGLPTLADGRTYQLWALVDGARISAGTLGAQPNVAAFHVSGPIGGFAVTDEEAPGVVASTNPPVLIGWLRSA
jgi:hypothetical protein